MTVCASLKLYFGAEPLIRSRAWEQEIIHLGIEVHCPYCDTLHEEVGTWGWYPTLTGDVRRFMCKLCDTTFNPAKIPFWQDKVTELIWKLAQLTITDQVTVNGLAKGFGIPESTLRHLITEIKVLLSDNYQLAKQIHERLTKEKTKDTGKFRVIFYDEGFLKILGATGFLLFTLDAEGTPISLAIEPQRDGETIYAHFVQASTQLGGLDVIVGDGAPAIVAATKALRQHVILVQQIHSGKAKRARIIKYEPIPLRKALEETTIELHTGSLLPNIESKLTVKRKKVYPPKYSPYKKRKILIKRPLKNNKSVINRNSTLTPVEGANKRKRARRSHPKLLKGHDIFLRTGSALYEYELNYIPEHTMMTALDYPTLSEIEGMLSIVQATFPHQFITSNRAEIFNALYDRKNHAWGVTTIIHANRHARAWAVMKYYPLGAKKLIQQHKWQVPYKLLKKLGFLMISQMQVV